MISLLGKFSLKANVEGSRSSQIGGEMSWYCHSAKPYFGLSCGIKNSGTLQLFCLNLKAPPSLLAGQLVQLSVDMSQSMLKSVIRPHKLLCGCCSPGSCCPGESRWGCWWGWTAGRVPLWSAGPPRFLMGVKTVCVGWMGGSGERRQLLPNSQVAETLHGLQSSSSASSQIVKAVSNRHERFVGQE